MNVSFTKEEKKKIALWLTQRKQALKSEWNPTTENLIDELLEALK